MEFLQDLESRPLTLSDAKGWRPAGLFLGQGSQPLEVAVLESTARPSAGDVRSAWKSRLGGRATPLLLVVLHGDRAALCGPSGDQPPVYIELERVNVERLCRAALSEPDRHSALRFLHGAIPEMEAVLPGLRNEGLFATHELEYGVPRRADWVQAAERGRTLLQSRGQTLLAGLGYTVEPLPGPAWILRASGTKTAIAVLLDRNESPEVSNDRFSGLSPVSYALAKADEENLPYVMVLAGPALRIYPARTGVGIGRRGRTETYAEVHLDLLDSAKAGYVDLIFSARALQATGSFEDILSKSSDFAVELGRRLRDRVYEQVVPGLAEAILDVRGARRRSAEALQQTYEMTLTALFRLLFVAYAEDKDLLPYRSNELYKLHSLKQKAKELLKVEESGTGWTDATTHWEDVCRLFRAVEKGDREWGVPPYDGGLFASESNVSSIGAALNSVKIKNDRFGPALVNLLLDETPEGRGPVDFRSLGVREFGTIYEGLLEQELSLSETDLTTSPDGTYRPIKKNTDVVRVRAGQAYLHNASGARKASGSYFTKSFAVDHLLDHALEPALDDHVARLDTIENDREAADAFFDFRVADVAMGSGHFLVGAVDRIERRFSSYLAKRALPDVSGELHRLRGSARAALGTLGDGVEIEDTQLLRRQIARRCIYGVDLNPLSVQLARLSIWVHTFVPGLPLSFLDHNLVRGNSLVGIATIEEALEELRKASGALFQLSAEALVGKARRPIERLGRLADADAAEIEAARKTMADARAKVAPAEALFDVIAAARIEDALSRWLHSQSGHLEHALDEIPESPQHRKARTVLRSTPPFHFPIAFPEVFLRQRTGFDVILGNPPWEEATVEEDRFWTRYEPGFHSLPQHEQEAAKRRLRRDRPDLVDLYEVEVARSETIRRLLTSGPFPGMGTGDPDVYKAFAWRFMQLIQNEDGRIGVVLPRNAFSAKGSAEFRKTVLASATITDLTTLVNNRGWVFDDVHPQYTIALVGIEKRAPNSDTNLALRGPFADRVRYDHGMQVDPNRFAVKEVLSWTDTAALPLLPSDTSAEVFAQLRRAPRLDHDDPKSWFARPHTELHATNDKKLMKLTGDRPDGFWPVYKGESFDIWEPDTGSYYAWADPEKMERALQEKRQRARTAFLGFPAAVLRDPRTLPFHEARVAFRDVTNRTNTRTVIAALVPPKVFVTNKGPFFLWPRGDEKDQAFLLGILASLPLDWYARRFVEINLNFFILNPFPIPRPPRDHPLWKRTVALAGRLASPDRRFARWAKAVGVEHGKLEEDEKADMIHELDAVVAHLYGLREAHLRHIFGTFHEGWDYEERLRLTSRHFDSWGKRL